jgi:prohibitin 2
VLFIVLGSIFLVATLVSVIIAFSATTSDGKAGAGLCALGGIVAFVLLSVFCSVHRVGQRQVGVVHSFSGAITGATGSGTIAWTAPWQNISKENIGLQKEEFYLNENNAAVSKDQQPIYADVQLNYQVEPKDVVKLYKEVGPSWKSILLEGRMLQDFKNVTASFTAAEITTKRPQLRLDTKDAMEKELAPYDIKVVDVLIKNIGYTQAYRDAINAKNVQVQQALQAEAKVKQSQAEAQQAVAKAQGDARAIDLKGEALRKHPEVLQLEAIDKLNPNAQVIICTGSGSGNCPSFLPQPSNNSRTP